MCEQVNGTAVVSPAAIRQVLGHFISGITVITALAEGEPVGFTCQSFSSLSLDPPMVSFSVSRASTSWLRVRSAPSLCINILSEDQMQVSNVFGRPGSDKFAGISFQLSPHGSPLIPGAAAFIDARVWAEYDGGDHTIVAATVLDLGADSSRTPLIFHRGGYGLRDVPEPDTPGPPQPLSRLNPRGWSVFTEGDAPSFKEHAAFPFRGASSAEGVSGDRRPCLPSREGHD